tara:strand:+ start:5108 stop:5296 length:189 start_codon:yes stop_codon:yes gene_type:complete
MFTYGQMIFGILFFLAFLGVIILQYRLDKKTQANYFKGSYKVLLGFLIAFTILLTIKILTQK